MMLLLGCQLSTAVMLENERSCEAVGPIRKRLHNKIQQRDSSTAQRRCVYRNCEGVYKGDILTVISVGVSRGNLKAKRGLKSSVTDFDGLGPSSW